MNRPPLYRRLPAALGVCGICLSVMMGCNSAPEDGPEIDTIAFASCWHASDSPVIWESILKNNPDVFLFIGDNVYVDVPRPPSGVEDFKRAYAKLAANTGWQALRGRVPVYATWDDHDYGLNDAGEEFALKVIAQQQFIEFFDPPEDSPIRQREGVYDAHLFGPEGRRVQIILLDTRTFRGPITRNPQGRVNRLGPYIPNPPGEGRMLGDAQWAWLEAQLRKPADVRIIASSIQVIADEHGWETWGNMPHERQRLFDLIKQTGANGVVFISGDRHLTEASMDSGPGTPYPMFDLTSSGMKERDRPVSEPNTHRMKADEVYRRSNFGLIVLDWDNADGPSVWLQTRTDDNQLLIGYPVTLESLRVDGQ